MRLTDHQKQLVSDNIGLVSVHLRRNVHLPPGPHQRGEYADLFQEGCVGLARAAASYAPGRDGPFAAYALPRIHHAISAALQAKFLTIRVPLGKLAAVRQGRRRGDPRGPSDLPVVHQLLAHDLPAGGAPRRPAEGVTLGDLMARRYERAVGAVAEQMRRAPGCAAGRDAMIDRFVTERLLVPADDLRTPLRQLARELGCSLGRVTACQERFSRLIGAALKADPEFCLLWDYVRRQPEGASTPVDAEVRRELADRRREALQTLLARTCDDRIAREVFAAAGFDVTTHARALLRRMDDRARQRLLDRLADCDALTHGSKVSA